jgi:hypothetical protein
MTIPSTPDYFLVQNILGMQSGLAEDVVVNSFIFRNTNQAGSTTSSAEERAAEAVRDFFAVAAVAEGPLAGGRTEPPMQLMSQTINSWTQKVYDLGDPPGGRAPVVFDRTAEMTTRSTGTKYPTEIAIVVSLQTPIIGRRGKGRIYLGPWSSTVADDTTGAATVAEAVRKRLAANAAKLALGNGKDMEWAVWSTTRAKMARVVGGWVDNDFDVQRRRGVSSSHRTKWGTTVPTQPATP